jgi:hypothetical protein
MLQRELLAPLPREKNNCPLRRRVDDATRFAFAETEMDY